MALINTPREESRSISVTATVKCLNLQLVIKPHPIYRREGDQLVMDLPISIPDAVLGGKVEAPTPDGAVMLNVPKASNSGQHSRKLLWLLSRLDRRITNRIRRASLLFRPTSVCCLVGPASLAAIIALLIGVSTDRYLTIHIRINGGNQSQDV